MASLEVCAKTDAPLAYLVTDHREPFVFAESHPSRADVQSVIPAHCFARSAFRSLAYTFVSVALTVGIGYGAWALIPVTLSMIPVWVLYAFVNGTVATGMWVIAHECGHGAFSDQIWLRDVVG